MNLTKASKIEPNLNHTFKKKREKENKFIVDFFLFKNGFTL